MSDVTRHRTMRLVGVYLAVSLMAMTCQSPTDFGVHNQSGRTLTVRILEDDSGSGERMVRTGSLTSLPVPDDGCDGTGVVAVGEDGEVVAELDQPACDGDVWVIEEDRAYLRE